MDLSPFLLLKHMRESTVMNNMSFSEAKQVLLNATFEPEGVFTHLRLGENPGSDKVLELRVALRQIWRSLAPANVVPRDIAFACGLILLFKAECLNNLQDAHSVSEEILHSLEEAVLDLAQGAFDVLAGSIAEATQRPDLCD
jgi:hypothetical protein